MTGTTTWAATGVRPPRLDGGDLLAVARAAAGSPGAVLGRWDIAPVEHAIGTGSTEGLWRVRGTVEDGRGRRSWSAVVKVVRSYRHALPGAAEPWVRERAAADLSWRHEADVYRSGLDDVLPPGMRMPRRYRVDDLGDDRVAVWLEDVAIAPVPWDLSRFAHAARLLGRLAVRLTRSEKLPESVFRVPGQILRTQALGDELFTLPALRGDAVWDHPHVAAAADPDLRVDLLRLAERVPAILDAHERLPQAFVHGDASPQNLLVPAGDPHGFVAIDWSLMGPAAVGYDLSQLLIGLAHAGEFDVDALPAVHDAIVPAYAAGLADEGMPATEAAVRDGLRTTLVVRSAFSALPLARLTGRSRPEDAALVARRVRLTRYLVDIGLGLPTTDDRRPS
jgi:hypothetical protein